MRTNRSWALAALIAGPPAALITALAACSSDAGPAAALGDGPMPPGAGGPGAASPPGPKGGTSFVPRNEPGDAFRAAHRGSGPVRDGRGRRGDADRHHGQRPAEANLASALRGQQLRRGQHPCRRDGEHRVREVAADRAATERCQRGVCMSFRGVAKTSAYASWQLSGMSIFTASFRPFATPCL